MISNQNFNKKINIVEEVKLIIIIKAKEARNQSNIRETVYNKIISYL
jgi:predicted small metal-binding protein